MSQTSYNIHITRALQNIASRFKNDIAPESVTQIGPIAQYKNTFTQQVSVDENVSGNTGPVAIIDVQPDYRNIILSLNYYITSQYPDMNFKPYPAMTPTALMAYYLALFYGFALLNDDNNIRKTQSAYSHMITTTRNLDRFLYKLRRFPVPPFIAEMLNGLQHGHDQRKQNLRYVNTFACFDLLLDFGRTPSILMYLAGHDIIASNQANTPVSTLLEIWYNTVIMSQPNALTVGNYLGVYDQEEMYINWFAQINRTLFNPVTNRTQSVRPTLMPAPLYPQQLGNDSTLVNPYIHLLGVTQENILVIENVLTSIASCVSASFKDTKELGSLISKTPGNMILNHYYSPLPLPTWHKTTLGKVTAPKLLSAEGFAARIHFKVPQKKATATIQPLPSKNEYTPALLLIKADKYDATKSAVKYESFNIMNDVTPDIRHFCPFETGSQEIHSNVTLGRHIECDELTSTDVPQPNPSNTIMCENGFFLESAYPIAQIRTLNYTRDSNIIHSIRQRTEHNSRRPVVRMSLVDRSIDRIPRFGPQVPGPIPETLPGYDIVENIPFTSAASSSICYRVRSGQHAPTVPTGIVNVSAWSSYRYYNPNSTPDVPIQSRKFLLLNFRTLHGTNVTLVETPHPALCIPRS